MVSNFNNIRVPSFILSGAPNFHHSRTKPGTGSRFQALRMVLVEREERAAFWRFTSVLPPITAVPKPGSLRSRFGPELAAHLRVSRMSLRRPPISANRIEKQAQTIEHDQDRAALMTNDSQRQR